MGLSAGNDEIEGEAAARRLAARLAALNVPARARLFKPRQHGLLGWSGLPDYLRDNEFIKGFLLFVCLTIYLARSPPTPLAFGTNQVEAVWGGVRLQLLQLQHGVQESLHTLQHGAEALSHNLAHGAEALSHNLQHGAGALTHNLAHGAEALTHNLQHTAEALSHNLQHGAQTLTHNLCGMHVREILEGLLHYPVSRWPFYVFMAGAMTCLLVSSVCHLFGCCSQHVSQLMWRFDYSGIAILIVTSFYPEIWYAFLCQPYWRDFYLITTTLMGIATITVSLMEVFQSPRYRFFRAFIFTALGSWGIVPVVHQWLAYPDVWAVRSALKIDLLMGLFYLVGAALFALRVPERWLPGKFDVFFASHQLFHVCVVIGALVHFQAIRVLLEWRDASGGCAAPVTAGPVEHVLRDLGEARFGLEEVTDQIRSYAMQHFGVAL